MYHSGDIVTLAGGHYRLREQLAGSAYGVVWRAEGGAAGAVALKLVNREQMERAPSEVQQRWSACAAREIAFLAGLAPWDARHIVRLLDHGQHEGLPALALELLDGDLATHMAVANAAGRRTGLARALSGLAQVNAALAKVHQHGWRYLDLKPGNLLVDAAGGTLKLADFGTNRSLVDAGLHSYLGTASWQAPEQFFPYADAGYLTDVRSDYFALGAVFFYLVTDGATLRYHGACADAYREHGSQAGARLRAAWLGAPPPVLAEDEAGHFLECARAEGGGNPEAALALLRALLAVRPQDRPRHALEISRLIAAAQGEIGVARRAA